MNHLVEKLLFEFNGKAIEAQTLPIPVDAIAEFHLRYELGFENLETEFGYRDTIGFINFENKQIWIDSSMEPGSATANEGRYLFTLSHEIGHDQLHRPYFEARHFQQNLFDKPDLTIMCRDAQKKEALEDQADSFASALLMPEVLIRQHFKDILSQLEFSMNHWALEDRVTTELCSRFLASRQAMGIRLNQLKLWSGLQDNRLLLR